jgi:predicted RNase H-like HicB family nuclease
MSFTAVYVKFPEGYAAFVEEVPGANTQGATLKAIREPLDLPSP